jgi:hypothetical protein
MKWFRIETVSGNVARISAMLIRLDAFAAVALAYVSADRIDEQTQAMLQATAQGQRPSRWG